MKLEFNMDIAEQSVSVDHTPGLSAQRLPLFTTAAGRFIARGGYYTEREGLENNYLLLYTHAGAGRLEYRGGEYPLPPGRAALIDCSDHQYYATASAEPWDFRWVHIGGAAAAEYEQRVNGGALAVAALPDGGRAGPAMDGIVRLLLDAREAQPDVKICCNLMEILTELVVAGRLPADAGAPHGADMDSAMAFARANYMNKLSIDDIIGGTHLSKYYFLRLFKRHTGMGLYEYLNNVRVAEAKRLLKDTDLTVGAVAQSVGFDDVNSFLRYFKKTTGATPAAFRKYYLY